MKAGSYSAAETLAGFDELSEACRAREGTEQRGTAMDDEQAIREAISDWLAASKEGDVQTLAAILDDDALFVVLGRPPFGKAEFLAGASGKPHRFDSSLDVRDVVVNGDWALTRVQLAIELTATRGAKAARFDGVTMSVWRKSATGRWLIWRDSNMVAPVGEAV
jgi:uncharacterized protein (TIGR02246 family)